MGDSEARSSRFSEIPFLSPAEWRVFSILSQKGPMTVRQLVEELETSPEVARSYTTILTLTQRLPAKGDRTQSERAASHGPASTITYSSSVSYVEALRRHAERFLTQFALNGPEDLSIIGEVIDRHCGGS